MMILVQKEANLKNRNENAQQSMAQKEQPKQTIPPRPNLKK